MSNKTNTNSSKAKPVKSSGWLVNLCAFVAVIFIGVSLILTKVGLSGKISGALSTLAQAISYLIIIASSFFYIRNRRNVWLWVAWAVSVVLILLYFIL